MGTLFDRLPVKVATTMVSGEHLRLVLDELELVAGWNVPGDVVEFGCNVGTTSLCLQQALKMVNGMGGRQLWCYDSFKGLPKPVAVDEGKFNEGACQASRSIFDLVFASGGVPLPVVKEGWFKDLKDDDLPKAVCLAFLDADLYESLVEAMRLVWPRLSAYGSVIVHDMHYPGPVKAVADFSVGKDMRKAWSVEGMACYWNGAACVTAT